MKIINLCLAFMAWIQCTISPNSGPDDQYTRLIKADLLLRLYPFDPSKGDHPYFRIENGDKITIRKVFNGHFAYEDIVHGKLEYYSLMNHHRVMGNPPIIKGQHGEVKVTLGDLGSLYYAPLTKTKDYWDNGHNSGRGRYFCTIERKKKIFLAGILRSSLELFVPSEVARVLFVNHLYPRVEETSFTAQLFVANTVRMEDLFKEL